MRSTAAPANRPRRGEARPRPGGSDLAAFAARLGARVQRLADANDLDRALATCLRSLSEANGWAVGEAWILVPGGSALELDQGSYCRTASLRPFVTQVLGLTVRPGVGLPGRTLQARGPVAVADVSAAPWFAREAVARSVRLKGALAIPIVHAGEIVAVLAFFDTRSRDGDERLVDLVARVSPTLGPVIRAKRVRDALHVNADHFQTIFDQGPVGMALVGSDGRFVRVNRALCQLLGYSEADLAARTVREVTHPEDVAAGAVLAARLIAGEIPRYQREKRYLTRDGRIVWVSLTSSLVRDAAGRPLYSLGIVEDITPHKRAEERSRILGEIIHSIRASLDLDAVLRQVVDGARRLCDSDIAMIALSEPETGVVVSRLWAGAEPASVPLRIEPGKGAIGHTLATGQPFRTDDYRSDPRITKDYLDVAARFGVVAHLGVPITGEGRFEGVLSVANRAPRPFTDADEAILAQLADHAAVALDSARLYRDAAVRAQRLERLGELARLIARSTDDLEVFDVIAGAIAALVDASAVYVWVVDPAVSVLRLVGMTGDRAAEGEFHEHVTLPLGEGVGGRIAVTGEPEYLADVQQDSRWMNPRLVEALGLHGYAGIPLQAEGRVLGLLSVLFGERREPSPDDRKLLRLLADDAAIAVRNAALLARERSARADAETSEERYRSLFEKSLAGIFVATVDGTVLEGNAALAVILGCATREELVGRQLQEFLVEPAEWARLIAGLRLIGSAGNLELRFRRPDGEATWILLNATRTGEGAGGRLEGQMLDLTERKLAEEAMRSREALRAVVGLARATAHEIENPLTPLIARLDLVARETGDPDIRRHVEIASACAETIRETVQRMLSMTRLEVDTGSPAIDEILDIRRSAPDRAAPPAPDDAAS